MVYAFPTLDSEPPAGTRLQGVMGTKSLAPAMPRGFLKPRGSRLSCRTLYPRE